MTKRNDSWENLTSLWQEEKGIDPKILAKSVQRKTWSMRIMVSLEVAVGVMGMLFALWLTLRNKYPSDLGLGIFILLFAAIGTFATVWVRKGAWAAASDGVHGQLELMLRRAKSGVKLAVVNLWALIPAFMLVGGVLYSRREKLFTGTSDIPQEIIWIVIIGNLALIGTGIWAIWYKKLKTREIRRLQKILDDLEK